MHHEVISFPFNVCSQPGWDWTSLESQSRTHSGCWPCEAACLFFKNKLNSDTERRFWWLLGRSDVVLKQGKQYRCEAGADSGKEACHLIIRKGVGRELGRSSCYSRSPHVQQGRRIISQDCADRKRQQKPCRSRYFRSARVRIRSEWCPCRQVSYSWINDGVGLREAAMEEGCTAKWLRLIILAREMFVRCTHNH